MTNGEMEAVVMTNEEMKIVTMTNEEMGKAVVTNEEMKIVVMTNEEVIDEAMCRSHGCIFEQAPTALVSSRKLVLTSSSLSPDASEDWKWWGDFMQCDWRMQQAV